MCVGVCVRVPFVGCVDVKGLCQASSSVTLVWCVQQGTELDSSPYLARLAKKAWGSSFMNSTIFPGLPFPFDFG